MKGLAWIGGALAIVAALLVTAFVGYRGFASPDLRWKVEAELLHRSPSVIVAEIDESGPDRMALETLADDMAAVLNSASPAMRVDGRGVLDGTARVHVATPANLATARALLAQRFVADDYTMTDDGAGMISLKPTPESQARALPAKRTQTAEVVRRRIAFAPNRITWLPDGRLQIEALIDDPAIIAGALQSSGELTFHVVHETASAADEYVPAGFMIAPGMEGVPPEVVRTRPEFTGERLARVNPAYDQQTGEPVLSFGLDARGTSQFCRLTRQLTGQRFAILFDGKVLTAPRINEPICGGSGQIAGNFTLESVNNLAIMLRSGPLPVKLRVVSARGPASF
ncbi:preprotein translocase subunit SecD [Terricaulis sp.]|uniref:preprotein translocase subunit SecD n=1 Tax=Terricaulis sp. TaxID=2768686 RepID=UPI0037838E97